MKKAATETDLGWRCWLVALGSCPPPRAHDAEADDAEEGCARGRDGLPVDQKAVRLTALEWRFPGFVRADCLVPFNLR